MGTPPSIRRARPPGARVQASRNRVTRTSGDLPAMTDRDRAHPLAAETVRPIEWAGGFLKRPERIRRICRLCMKRLGRFFALAVCARLTVVRRVEWMRRGPAAAAPSARAAAAPATPAPPSAAATPRRTAATRLTRLLDAPPLVASAFEPRLRIPEKVREYFWVAAGGGRYDFEHVARLVEIRALDEPARAARGCN